MKLITDALLLSGFWFIALYTIKMANIQKMAIKNSDDFVWRQMIFISKILLFVWIVVEIGLLNKADSVVFMLFRDILALPLFSHLMFLANVIVLISATITMSSKALETERYIIKAEKKAITFANGLIVLGISLIIFYIQSVYWGEFSYLYSKQSIINLKLEAVLDAVFVLFPGLIILWNAVRYVRKERIRRLAFRISVPIILLLALTQTIMSKLIVVHDILKSIQKLILKKVGFDVKTLHEDPLLIASSLSFGKKNARINAYYVTAYFFAVVIIWTSQVSPFPLQSNLYENGMQISFYLSLSIFVYWIIENLARLMGKNGKFLRAIFIPTMLALTIYPFYTSFANINSVVRTTDIISIYHKMAFALGDNKYLFFLCLAIMQSSIAYILHVITGEAHNDRHHYSVMPIILIVQVMVLSIMYPVFLSIPSYTLKDKLPFFLISITIAGILITMLMSAISYHLFTSIKSTWSSYVHEFWKSKKRVYIIVACITLLSFSPLYAITIDSIHNQNIQFAWENSYIKSNQNFLVTALIEGPDPKHVYVLENNDTGTSKLLNISAEDGQVIWEKSYSENYDRYKVWSNNTLVLLKKGNMGYTVLNLRTGKKVYDYKIDETVHLEFLNLEANDRTVLMTENTNQTLFDRDYGLITLDTLGNNFYELIEGNQCALIKNNQIYIYQNDRLEKTKGIYNFDAAEYIYYDENGMIVFNKDEIIQYTPDLQTLNSNQFLKIDAHNIKLYNHYFKKINDEVTFYMFDGYRKYAYVFNSKEFTYRVITLEQRIKGLRDFQNIKICDNEGHYFLFDDYQLTLFDHENLVARQWYQLPLHSDDKVKEKRNEVVTCEPVLSDGKIIWIEIGGQAHAVTIE